MSDPIAFVLVGTKNPANLGATARALKTMGHKNLCLVKPETSQDDPQALAVAHNAEEILQGAKTYSSLSQCLQDEGVEFSVACTARHRQSAKTYIDIQVLNEFLAERSPGAGKTSIVFGNESHGLSNEDLNLCDVVSTIPTAQAQPSLNLAQAVMLYAYSLSEKSQVMTEDRRLQKQVSNQEFQYFKDSVAAIFEKIGIDSGDRLHQKLLSRLPLLSGHDLKLLSMVRTKLVERLK